MSRPATLTVILLLGVVTIPIVESVFDVGIGAPVTRRSFSVSRPLTPFAPIRVRTAEIPASLPVAVAAAPGAIAPASRPSPATLPPMLELVTILPPSGVRASDPKPISRTEAVAAVMASPEFRDTLEPIARLYLATFGRYPDYDGINHYTGQREEARPLPSIADEFAASREFEERYGKLTNAEFVARIMANVLGNESQSDVRAYWTDELETGRMTRGQMILDLSESGAFRERSANEIFVSTAYVEILHRTPDPDGYSRWVATLDAGHPYRTVIDGLLAGR